MSFSVHGAFYRDDLLLCLQSDFCANGNGDMGKAFWQADKKISAEAMFDRAPSALSSSSASNDGSQPVAVRIWVCTLTFLAALCCAFVSTPHQAYADSYEMPKVIISAAAQTDGSLHVIESRTFVFEGTCTKMKWAFEDLSDEAKLIINGVRITRPSETGGDALSEDLQSVPFRSQWRDDESPDGSVYAFDTSYDTAYVFFSAADETLTITLDYTVENGIIAYKDVAEVYWKYVSSQWPTESSDVTMTLSLPVPQGAQIKLGENVRAWGHGPSDGVVTLDASGTISYTVPCVLSGQYSEAHVIFPIAWLSNLSAKASKDNQETTHLTTAISEEQTWTDQGKIASIFSLWQEIVCAAVCALLLAWVLFRYMVWGREYKPSFTETYWCELPDENLHPALIGRLWRWNRKSIDDFVAEMGFLMQKGVLRIERAPHGDTGETPAASRAQASQDCRIVRQACDENAALTTLDDTAIEILFTDIAQGSDMVTFSAIADYAQDHREVLRKKIADWQKMLSVEVAKCDFFEGRSKRIQVRLMVLSLLLFIGGLVSGALSGNQLFALFMIPTAVALFVIANYMPRRSVYGNEIVAKCKALRNYLRDLSASDKFSVYAYLFGVERDGALKQLSDAISICENES